MPRPKKFRSSKTEAPVIPPKGTDISLVKPQFIPQDGPVEIPEPATETALKGATETSTSEKQNSKKRPRAQSESQPSKKKAELPLPPPQDLLPPSLRADVEKRLGAGFWGSNVKAPYTVGSFESRTDVLKKLLTLDPQSQGSVDTVLASSASGAETLKIISPLEAVVRNCRPRGEEGEEVVEWFKYESLGSVVTEIARDGNEKKKWAERVEAKKAKTEGKKAEKGKKSKKSGGDARMDDISIDGESDSEFEGFGEQGGVDLGAAKVDAEEEEPAFEAMDVEGKEKKEIDASRPKIRAIPILTIWLSKKPIPEFKETFGEKEIKVAKWKGEEDVVMT